MTADFSYSLEALERRWQLEKTPQVGLRLAEEYRRKGDLDASIGALAAGLEVYPNHTSSRVALSRYLVDGGRFAEAVVHLEQIVSLDPAHLVANKLLVGAYAGLGRMEEARDKLAIYEMMGEGDADIEPLRALLEAARETTTAGVESPREVQSSEGDAGPSTEAGPSPDPEPSADPEPEPAVLPAVLEAETGGFGDAPEPGFGFGTRGIAMEADYLPEAEAGPEEQGLGPFEVPASVLASAPLVGAEASGDELLDEPFDEPFGTAFETVSSGYRQGFVDEGIFVLEVPQAGPPVQAASPPDEVRGGSEPIEQLPALEIPMESSLAPADHDPARPVEPVPQAGASTGTVTLGKLYREQGHREQAAEVFGEVLAREPANEAARRELEATARAEPREPTGRSIANPRDRASISSRADRRREALTTYRARLRRAVAAGI